MRRAEVRKNSLLRWPGAGKTPRPVFVPDPESGGQLSLGNIYPNPFYAVATIPFTLFYAGYVKLDLYDAEGRYAGRLVDRQMPAGNHNAIICKEELRLPSGDYMYQLSIENLAGCFKTRKQLTIR